MLGLERYKANDACNDPWPGMVCNTVVLLRNSGQQSLPREIILQMVVVGVIAKPENHHVWRSWCGQVCSTSATVHLLVPAVQTEAQPRAIRRT